MQGDRKKEIGEKEVDIRNKMYRKDTDITE